MRAIRHLIPIGLICAIALPAAAATADEFLRQYASTYRFRLGHATSAVSTPDGKSVLFLRSGPRSFQRSLYEFDLAGGTERLVLDASSLLGGAEEQLSAEEKARRERQRMVARGIASFSLSSDGRRILVPLGGRLFVVERADGSVRELRSSAGYAIDPQLSPDGRQVACVRDGELYVTDIASGAERRLTSGAGGSVTHGLAEFVAQEEMGRHHGFWWSPDSRHIAYQQTDTAGLEVMTLVDAVAPQRPPKGWPYPRPGHPNARVRLGVVAATGGETTWVGWDHETFEYLAAVQWADHAPLTLVVQNRRQTEQRVLAVDLEDGGTTTLLVERDPAWVRIEQEVPAWLPDGSAFVWITDRNGGPQLELRGRDGALQRALTDVALGLQELEHLCFERGSLIVRASQDPTQSQLFRVPLERRGGDVEALTSAPGIHDAVSGLRGPLFVVTSVGPGRPPSSAVFDADGPTGGELRSVAETPALTPRVEFVTVGEDPSYHAALVRPHDFDAGRRYPVIVHVYGGPGHQQVRMDPARYLLDQWFADRGYVVVAIDGRGTPGRGRDWERAIKHDLIELPLSDQAAALRALGQRFEELDLARVGIYGWSFGGYFSALAVMREPDLFRAGVAGAPVVDWHDYDTHYTERYMDLPELNAEGYASANVLTHAGKLDRPLLLIHGTDDDNVYFLHSLKLADALFRAGRPFNFLPLTGFTHMVPDPLVTERLYERIAKFFDDNLPAHD